MMGAIEIAGLQMIFAPIILMTVFTPIIIYIVARWRSHRDDAPDPQLGIKVAICWFKMAAFLLLLLGVFIVCFSIVADLPSGAGESAMRVGAGLILPSLLIFAIQYFVLVQTNSEQRPTIARMFTGVTLVYTGLVTFGALTIGGIMLFQEDSPSELNRTIVVAILIYGGATASLGIRLMREVTGAFMPTAKATISTDT